MELFEKAHSLTKPDSKKNTKSEEKTKKQLKQMLHGYKKSDNELIMKSEDNVIDDLDSTSVSGFSDLNLTYTGSDNETTMATIDSSDLDSLPIFNEKDAPLHKSFPDVMDSTDNDDFTPESKVDLPETLDENTSPLSSNISNLDSSELSLITSDSSNVFDVDGTLALMIHERLNDVKKKSKPKLKRKYDENTDFSVKELSLVHNSDSSSEVDSPSPIKTKIRSPKNNLGLIENIQDSSKKKDYKLSDGSNMALAPSPNFISITATNVKTQKFDDMFGHYKNSTIKSINTDQSKVTFSSFDIEDIDEANIEEDASLTGDTETDKNESETGLEITDVDSSTQINSESVDLTEETAQSEPAIDSENSIQSVDPPIIRYKVYSGRNCYIMVLRHPMTLFLHGKVVISKLAGSAQIFGYNLKDTSCEVYAPFYNFAQTLSTSEVSDDYYGLFGKLTKKGITITEAEEIVTTLGSDGTVILLEKLNSLKMSFVESFFNKTNLFNLPSESLDLHLKKVSQELGCSIHRSQPYKHFEESPNWHAAVKIGLDLGKKSRGIVCGGKGSGKSTFLRFYVNQLLTQGSVLVIDLDPGQCEFTVAGSISATIVNEPLLGPNFTHLKTPEIMLNLGMISTMDHSSRYITAVDMLLTRCAENQTLSGMPWIINTMGMTNAIGLKFMCYIILKTQPTFLMQIELQAAKKNFEHRLTPYKVDELGEVYKNDGLFSKMSNREPLSYYYILTQAESYRVNKHGGADNYSLAPRDERYLNFLAYFGELAQMYKCVDLLGVTPYSVRLQDVQVASNVKLHPSAITKVLNGKIVALCEQSAQPDNTAKMFKLAKKPLLCHGHGLIRGIDYEKDELYVITPLPSKDLGLVNIILYADWVPELRGQEKNLQEGTVVPYRTQSQYQQRQFMFTPRRRFNPLQLLKMSRNS